MVSQSTFNAIDIYNHKAIVEAYILKGERSTKLFVENKEVYRSYYRSMVNDALHLPTIVKHLQSILVLGERIGERSFKSLERKDFEEIVYALRSSPRLSPHTVHKHLTCYRKFYKWLSGGETYPESVKWIRPQVALQNQKLPESLLNQEEVKHLINAARHPRDKCLLSILNETGCRVGEILSMDIRHIEDCGDYYRMSIQHSKTIPRKLKLVDSKPFIAQWLNLHPRKDGQDSPLFIKIGSKGIGKRMPYTACRILISKIAHRIGIEKGVNPHNWRHSTATRYANFMSYAQLCHWFGWVIGSKTASIYIHLSGQDLDNVVDEMRGKKSSRKLEDTLASKMCLQCRKENIGTNDLCDGCGGALNIAGVLKKEDRIREMELEMKAREKVVEEYMRFQNEKLERLEKQLKG